jgi:hypothetical protein
MVSTPQESGVLPHGSASLPPSAASQEPERGEGEPTWISADRLYELHAERRNDEWGDAGELDIWVRAVRQRDAMLGECLLRMRLALTAQFLESHAEAEAVLAAAIALLVEHDVIDPSQPEELSHD